VLLFSGETSPGIKMIIEIAFKTVDGPPTLNTDGNIIFRIKPIIKNGNVSSPILSPLPTSTFSFIFFPSIFLLLDLLVFLVNAAPLSIGDYKKLSQSAMAVL
jgi:hypothetical protein